MASSRADEVAEILWELKRAGKVATFTHIARRAGFSPGTNGRTMVSCLRVVRRDWPHLHWWRAVRDDGNVEATDHGDKLRESGFELEPTADGKQTHIKQFETHLMVWEIAAEAAATNAAAS